jgi:Helix-turn-helix domain
LTEMPAPPDKIGIPAKHKPGNWVQTERKAHEAWARLWLSKPRAAALAHHLVAQMGHQNAVVVSQKTLAKLMGLHERTVRRAIADLVEEKWIQVIQLNGPGTVSAYVINDRVAWGQPRDQLRLSVFSANVVADAEDQDAATLEHGALRRIPVWYPGEQQLPTGPGEDPPAQASIPGMEPDLPALPADTEYRADLEARGQQRITE